MSHEEAMDFIRPAVIEGTFIWADLGAGSGVFTKALAELLGMEGTVYAVDRSSQIHAVKPPVSGATLYSIQADFTKMLELPRLDGLLMANSLHYVLQKEQVLKQLLQHLKPSGTFVLIEYDRAIPNPWVPYPIREKAFARLAQKVGLSNLQGLKKRPSNYGQGDIYSIMAKKH